jgi:hypothetical protein
MTKKGGTRRIYFKVESFEPDPVQFKPGKPFIRPNDLYLALDVPEEYFLVAQGLPKGSNCLTEKGFHKVRKVISGLDHF